MDEILNKSLIALTNVIKNIDKSVLDDIIKRIDSLEENSLTVFVSLIVTADRTAVG